MSAIRYPLRTTTLAAAICATLGGFPVQVAMAQEAGASKQQTYTFNIPAGPLEQALVQLSSATGTTVSFTPDRVKGIEAPALKGTYTAQSALSRVLAGSGLVAQALPNGSYSVQPMAANMLKPVTVSAAGMDESAYGPVDGYVATRSAAGTKTDALLIETPQSISVVTADQMEKQGADTLAEALKYTPNIAPLDGDINALSITGFTMRGFNITGSEPLYVNGSRFPVNSFSAAEQPYLFERVEVLRGPASVLYGQAAPGGIINLVTKQPTLKRVRELKLATDSYGSAQTNVDAGGRLTEDGKWSYRVTGLVRDGKTRIDEVPDDRRAIQAGLQWSPTDDTDLTMRGNYQTTETVWNPGKPEDGSMLPNPNGEYDPNVFLGEPGFDNYDAERFTLGYLLEHRFSDALKARQSVLWYDAEINWSYLSTGDPDPVDRRMVSRFPGVRGDSDQGWSIDNQLMGEFQHGRFMHTVLAGLSFSQSDFKRGQARGSVDPIDGFDPVYGAPVALNPSETTTDNKSTQLGVYMQDQVTFADKWVALIGGRWDDAKIKDKLAGSTTSDDSAFTYRAGLVRLFDNGVAPYITYSQSFQPQTGSDFEGKSFVPTEGKQYEAGIKYQPLGTNAMVTVSVFDITQQNVVTVDLANPNFSEQTGEVQSKGYEVEAKTSLNQLDLIASYAFVDAEVTESNSGNEGNVPTSAPRHTAALWADYRLASGVLSGMNLGGGVQYTGESYNLDNSIKVPSYTVVNAAVGYEYDRWQFDLNVNNLLGEEYISRCTFNCFYGAERSAELAVTYSW